MPSRRQFLNTAGAGLLTSLCVARTAFASVPTDRRLVLIFLRGGLDGLHVLPPHADPAYHRLRPRLGFGAAHSDLAALDIDGYFGLNPALRSLLPLYRSGELLFLPAAATAYRNRSHFDGQNMLENGSGKPFGARDGWLNRAILAMNAGDRRMGLALGPSMPLILQGEGRVETWDETGLPELNADFLMHVSMMYQADQLFADALHDASGALRPDVDAAMMGGETRGASRAFLRAATATGEILARASGPRIAVMELQGWDTHFAQDRRMRKLLTDLARAITQLRTGLSEVWDQTAIMVVSEFGRTAAENGQLGTDHGTGGLAMMTGGAVKGGKVIGDWPGLDPKSLFEGRDLRPVNGYEALFKSVLLDHLGVSQTVAETAVLPSAAGIAPFEGIFHRS